MKWKNDPIVSQPKWMADPVVEGDFNAGDMLRNVPKSAGRMVNDMYQAVAHPIETGKALGNLALGVAQKAIPGTQDKEVYADQVGQFIIDRYGSMDKFKATLMDDPVGVLADASAVLAGGGTITSKLPGVAGKAGRAVQRAGVALDPVNVAVNTAEIAGKAVPKVVPRKLYDSSAKWPTTADIKDPGKRARMTETVLREGIPPNQKGVGEMHLVMGDLGKQIGDLIENAGDAPISPYDVYKSLDDAEAKMTGFKMNAKQNAEVFARARDQLTELIANKDGPITARDLQDFKIDLGKETDWDVRRLKSSRAENEASKAIYSGARKSLEQSVPGVDEINKRLSDLYEVEPHLERAAARRDNNNQLSLTGAAAITAGAQVGDTAGAVTGGALSAIQRKGAEIAVYLEKLRKQKVPENYIQNRVLPAMLRQAAVELGKLQSVDEPDNEVVRKNAKN